LEALVGAVLHAATATTASVATTSLREIAINERKDVDMAVIFAVLTGISCAHAYILRQQYLIISWDKEFNPVVHVIGEYFKSGAVLARQLNWRHTRALQ
jgi:hypothetical protein